MNCKECGQEMEINNNGIANHLDSDGNIDHNADAEHVALAEEIESKVPGIVDEINNTHTALASGALKSVPASDKRISLLTEGLHALAADHDLEIAWTTCDANGEFNFNIKGSSDGTGKPYGEKLAALLSKIYTRTGINPSKGHVIAQNNWCRINHFEAEKLLNIYVEELLA